MSAIVGNIIGITLLPVFLIHAFLDDAAHLTKGCPVFNSDVQVSQAFPVHERKALLGEGLALALDTLAFTVVDFVARSHNLVYRVTSAIITEQSRYCYIT